MRKGDRVLFTPPCIALPQLLWRKEAWPGGGLPDLEAFGGVVRDLQ